MCALVISRVVILKTGFSLAFNHHCNITLHERKVKHLAAEGILYGQMVTPPPILVSAQEAIWMNFSHKKKYYIYCFSFLHKWLKRAKFPSVVQVYHAYLQTPNVCLFKKKKKGFPCVVLLQFFWLICASRNTKMQTTPCLTCIILQ